MRRQNSQDIRPNVQRKVITPRSKAEKPVQHQQPMQVVKESRVLQEYMRDSNKSVKQQGKPQRRNDRERRKDLENIIVKEPPNKRMTWLDNPKYPGPPQNQTMQYYKGHDDFQARAKKI